MTDVRLAELDYSWAASTFNGTGFGVVGVSPSWQWGREGGREGISEWIGSQGIDASDDSAAGMEFDPQHPFGGCLVLKRALGRDLGGRPGRYVTRMLVDPTRRLTAADALAVAARELPVTDWPVDATPDAALDEPMVAAPAGPPRAEALAAALRALDAGGLVIVAGLADPLTSFAAALAALPPAWSRALAVSTFNAQRRMTAGVVLSERRVDSAGTGVQVLAVSGSTTTELPLDARFTTLAERYLTLAIGERTSTATTLEGLEQWLDAMDELRAPVTAVAVDRLVAQALDAPDDRRRACVDEIVRRELVGDLDSAARRLAAHALPDGIRAGMIRDLATELVADRSRDTLAVLAQWGATAEVRGRFAAAALESRGFGDAASPRWREALAPAVQGWVGGMDSTARLSAAVADAWITSVLGSTWGPGSETACAAFWVWEDGPHPALAPLAEALAERFPTSVARAVRLRRPPVARLERALSMLPADAARAARSLFVPPQYAPAPLRPQHVAVRESIAPHPRPERPEVDLRSTRLLPAMLVWVTLGITAASWITTILALANIIVIVVGLVSTMTSAVVFGVFFASPGTRKAGSRSDDHEPASATGDATWRSGSAGGAAAGSLADPSRGAAPPAAAVPSNGPRRAFRRR